ncbi:MAG TPA: hypothetical protein VF147_18720 [Vicinamibacterales bacterium]
MANTTLSAKGASNRWVIYCRERFPLPQTGASVAAFTFATLSFAGPFSALRFIAAFAVAFLFFLELRILDEFKDAEDDATYRPYRPVPRGLVSLRELGTVGLAGAVIQFALAALASPAAITSLVATFAWMALMAREFFVSAWLRAHPVAYLASHTAVMPFITVTVASFGGGFLAWDGAGLTYLAFTCVSAVVMEIGRKLRAPPDEEKGVETYTFLWGRRRAVTVWLLCIVASGVLAVIATGDARSSVAMGGLGLAALLTALACGLRFLVRPSPGAGRILQGVSAVWILVAYVGLGVAVLARTP